MHGKVLLHKISNTEQTKWSHLLTRHPPPPPHTHIYLRQYPTEVGSPGAVPEQLLIVQLRELLVPLVLIMSARLEHLHHFQVVLSVSGAVGIAHIGHQPLELFTVLGQNLEGGGGREERWGDARHNICAGL